MSSFARFLRGGRPRSGFTLIELLVVVAIIALLISILLPSLAKARDQAKELKCGANLKNILLAMQYYSGDHNEKWFYFNQRFFSGPNSG